MGVIDKGHTFVSGENVTADKLNNLADDATFNSDTTDNTTLEVHSTGYLKVKDAGIDTQHLANDAVTTDKITNANVTYAKIQNVAANSVIGNRTASEATPQAISIADLSTDVVANISNSTAHTSDSNSDGTNDTGGTDGLMSAGDKTKLDGLTTYSAGTGLKLTGDTFSLDDTAPTSALTSAPTGKTGGAMIAYRQVTNSSGGGGSTSNRVAAGWFHYGDAQIEFNPTVFFDQYGNNVPDDANWAIMQAQITTTDIGANGTTHSHPSKDLALSVWSVPQQNTSYTNKNAARSSEDSEYTIAVGTLRQSVTLPGAVGSWASAGGTYSFSAAHQVASHNSFSTQGSSVSQTFLVPIVHNGNGRSVQLYVDFSNSGTGTWGAEHLYECSGYNIFFIGYIL